MNALIESPEDDGELARWWLQVWDVIQHGYGHARSREYTGGATALALAWMRVAGDLVFIFAGSVPLAIAASKAWRGVRRTGSLPQRAALRPAG